VKLPAGPPPLADDPSVRRKSARSGEYIGDRYGSIARILETAFTADTVFLTLRQPLLQLVRHLAQQRLGIARCLAPHREAVDLARVRKMAGGHVSGRQPRGISSALIT